MNIKNTLSLNIEEAVELLTNIADSLEQTGKFHFNLRGQEVSVDVGSDLIAKMGIGINEFSLEFSWNEDETAGVEEISKLSSEIEANIGETEADIGKEAPIAQSIPKAEARHEPLTQKRPIPVTSKPRRALPDRMMLNTTTLPLEGGYWAPAFGKPAESQWIEILIDQDLENRKWVAEGQVTTLSDLTPDQAKPRPSRSSPTRIDDDLFSELDELDNDKSRPVTNNSTPSRQSAAPAARPLQNIPAPARISPSEVDAEARKWKEPTPEGNVTNDNWVKPSEFLKDKQNKSPAEEVVRSIPSPKRIDKPPQTPPPQSSGPKSIPQPKSINAIPQPKKIEKERQEAARTRSAQSQSEIVDEIRGWEEPKPEDNVTEDDWVRPSEFLKSKDSPREAGVSNIPAPPPANKDVDNKITRPPPKAPDAKKKDKDEDNSKGWASWDE